MSDESNSNNDVTGLESYAIQDTMSTEGGRHLMWRILEQSRVFTDNFNPDPYQHAKNSGNRQVGLWLEEELKQVAFASYIEMIKEHKDG